MRSPFCQRPVGTAWRLSAVGALLLMIAVGCGKKSPTGKPGPLFAPWSSADLYTKQTAPDPSPAAYAADLKQIKQALPFDAEKRQQTSKTLKIDDDGKLAAEVKLTWATFDVGGKHVFARIEANVVKHGDHYTCRSKGPDLGALGFGVQLFPKISLEIRCEAVIGDASSNRGAFVYFGDGAGSDQVHFSGWNDKVDTPHAELFRGRLGAGKKDDKGGENPANSGEKSKMQTAPRD